MPDRHVHRSSRRLLEISASALATHQGFMDLLGPRGDPPRAVLAASTFHAETPAVARVSAFVSPVELRGFEPLTP